MAISKLKVDASVYTEGAGTFNLFNYGSRIGSFDPFNITISGLGSGLSGSITYDADSMDLVITAASSGPALSAFTYNPKKENGHAR